MKKELNEKQKLFCLEYLKDFNGTRAYKTVY
ncbi:MAG: terminase small subunit [Methanobrevibacter sp.]|nr:terminase small subunit [Methanobrevibacter sp.]